MTDIEYDILDELYFVTPFETLKEESGFTNEDLKKNLINLVNNGLVKVFFSMEEEAEDQAIDMEEKFETYYYLASKKGLFEHNSR